MSGGGHGGGGGGMLRTILVWLAIAIAVILVVLWVLSGGIGKIVGAAKGITNPFSSLFGLGTSSASAFQLPWQPETLVYGVDPSDILGGSGGESTRDSEDELGSLESEYETLRAEIGDAKTFGTPSPYRGKVSIVKETGASGAGAEEYVEVGANISNTSPVNITGWSLQSALTGVRGFIPRAARVFVMGSVNQQTDIYLNPGDSAIISSVSSPVGISFRENMCSGYLSQLQAFTPPLGSSCPSPYEVFPGTAENLQTYGEACFDFVRSLSSCTFPLTVSSNISPACRTFLTNNLSYNGCVQHNQHESDFASPAWRIYLGAGGGLWRDTHDVIRLLDAEGRTVDVLTY